VVGPSKQASKQASKHTRTVVMKSR